MITEADQAVLPHRFWSPGDSSKRLRGKKSWSWDANRLVVCKDLTNKVRVLWPDELVTTSCVALYWRYSTKRKRETFSTTWPYRVVQFFKQSITMTRSTEFSVHTCHLMWKPMIRFFSSDTSTTLFVQSGTCVRKGLRKAPWLRYKHDKSLF